MSKIGKIFIVAIFVLLSIVASVFGLAAFVVGGAFLFAEIFTISTTAGALWFAISYILVLIILFILEIILTI